MDEVNGLKKMGMKKGGLGALKEKFKKKKPRTRSKKRLSPQERKEIEDRIKKRQGKITNPFVTLDSLGRPTMEAKKGGLAAATAKLKAQGLKKGGFPDLSGDGKVTMKDILMGRGVIKKTKKKAAGGSMTLEGGKLKGVKDAPEERRREKLRQGLKNLAGRAAKRGYGIARK
jgi:hypothetical protein|tara:strand:- start:518 stop:1033 length:516 start_codon:yes stop_codon:yes gene_type:complete